MSAPASQVTFGGVAISGYSTLGEGGLQIAYSQVTAGQSDLDMSDGTLVRQSFFSKWQIVITGSGTVPPQLRALEPLTTTKSLTVPDVEGSGGTETYTVWGTLQEDHSINAQGSARATWSLTCREA